MTILFDEPLPGGWTHDSGYRLESGISYEHEESGLTGSIECGYIDEAGPIEYTIKVRSKDGDPIEGPDRIPTKSEATSKLHDWLSAHA